MTRIHLSGLFIVFLILGFRAPASFPSAEDGVPKDQAAPGRLDRGGGPLPADVIRSLATPAFRHKGPVTELAIVNGGKELISGSWHEGALLWDVVTGTRLRKLADRVSMGLAVAPTGDFLAVRSGDRGIAVYNLAADTLRFTFQAENPLALAFSPDGKTLASGGSNNYEIRLCKTATGEASGTLKGHKLVVFSVVFHPDGKTLFSVSQDGTLRRWDFSTGQEIGRLTEAPGWFGYSLALSTDGKTLAMETGTGEGFSPENYLAHVRLLDTATLKERFRAVLPASRAQDVAVSPNGRYVAAAFAKARPVDGFVRLWDSWTGKQIRLDPGNTQPIYRVCFFPDGKTLASAGNDGVVRLWNVANGVEHVLTKGPGAGRVEQVAISPSGTILASATGGGPIELWDISKGALLRPLGKDATSQGALVFSEDGTFLASSALNHPAFAANVWNVRTGELLHTFQPLGGRPAFSRDGKLLAAAETENVRLWDAASGAELRRFKANHTLFHAVSFSSDNRLLAAAGTDQLAPAGKNSSVRLWQVSSGRAVRTLALRATRVELIWFSVDGLLLFTYYGAQNQGAGMIDVFDVAAGECVLTANAANMSPQGIWSAPGGAVLIVASASGKFRTLDMVTGKALGTDVAYGGEFTAAEFAPDGKTLALGYEDGSLLLWKPPPVPRRNPLPGGIG